MGFIYPNKFTYLNFLVIQLAQRCSDNGGPTAHVSVVVLVIGSFTAQNAEEL